ncbi:hypothetical protein [Streptomyces sp. NPDC054863]
MAALVLGSALLGSGATAPAAHAWPWDGNGVFANKFVAKGDKAVVSGFMNCKTRKTVSLVVYVSGIVHPVLVDSASGTATASGLTCGTSNTNFEITVPANVRPGTYTAGREMIVTTTMHEGGTKIDDDTTIRWAE